MSRSEVNHRSFILKQVADERKKWRGRVGRQRALVLHRRSSREAILPYRRFRLVATEMVYFRRVAKPTDLPPYCLISRSPIIDLSGIIANRFLFGWSTQS